MNLKRIADEATKRATTLLKDINVISIKKSEDLIVEAKKTKANVI